MREGLLVRAPIVRDYWFAYAMSIKVLKARHYFYFIYA